MTHFWHGKNNFVHLIIQFVMNKRNNKKGFLGGYRYSFREVDSESELGKKMAESVYFKEKTERAKESLRKWPIPEDMIREMIQSGKRKH
ncbi:MAG: hypothetical protein BGO52_06920 [Sphingobacteriales bacterium 44-61]|nr:MAG: hypothetical protein BGO52_06920 [Sphingobacteriales bacterium 44-61]